MAKRKRAETASAVDLVQPEAVLHEHVQSPDEVLTPLDKLDFGDSTALPQPKPQKRPRKPAKKKAAVVAAGEPPHNAQQDIGPAARLTKASIYSCAGLVDALQGPSSTHLDPEESVASSPREGKFPCLEPGCEGKKPFLRRSDLVRHSYIHSKTR